MASFEKPSYFAIIPSNVRYDVDLTANAKLLYAEITTLTNMNGACFASDNYFSKLYGVSKTSVQKWLKQLEVKGYINRNVEYKKGTKEIECRYITVFEYPTQEKLHTPTRNKLRDNNTTKVDNNINLTDSNRKPNIDYQDIKETWNAIAGKTGLPTIKMMTDDRKKKVKKLLSQVTVEEFKEVLNTKLSRSSFLKGENDRKWKADFDFIVNQNKFTKVAEGAYDDKGDNDFYIQDKKEVKILF